MITFVTLRWEAGKWYVFISYVHEIVMVVALCTGCVNYTSRPRKSQDEVAQLRHKATENGGDSPPTQKLETALQEPMVFHCTL